MSPAQGTSFAAALQKAGVPVEFVLVKNGNHGLGTIPGGAPTVPDGNTLRARMLAFFAKYLN